MGPGRSPRPRPGPSWAPLPCNARSADCWQYPDVQRAPLVCLSATRAETPAACHCCCFCCLSTSPMNSLYRPRRPQNLLRSGPPYEEMENSGCSRSSVWPRAGGAGGLRPDGAGSASAFRMKFGQRSQPRHEGTAQLAAVAFHRVSCGGGDENESGMPSRARTPRAPPLPPFTSRAWDNS